MTYEDVKEYVMIAFSRIHDDNILYYRICTNILRCSIIDSSYTRIFR